MGEHHIQVPKDYKTEYGYRECDYCPRYSHNNAKTKGENCGKNNLSIDLF